MSKLSSEPAQDIGAQVPGWKRIHGFLTTPPSFLQDLASNTELGDYCLRFSKPSKGDASCVGCDFGMRPQSLQSQVEPPSASLVHFGTQAAPAECSGRGSVNQLSPQTANSDFPNRFVKFEISIYTHPHPPQAAAVSELFSR